MAGSPLPKDTVPETRTAKLRVMCHHRPKPYYRDSLMSGCSGGMRSTGNFEVNRRKRWLPAPRSFTIVF